MNLKKKPFISRDEGFIVEILFLVFFIAERISIFYWFRKIINGIWIRKHKRKILNDKNGSYCKKLKTPLGKSYILPELWAVGNVLGTILFFKLIEKSMITSKVIIWIILIISFLRVWELIIYQINVLFFHRLNNTYLESPTKKSNINKAWEKFNSFHNKNKSDEYAIKSAMRTVILLIINMVEYIFQFSLMYTAISVISGSTPEISNILASFEIFMNLSTFENLINNSNIYLVRISQIETILGIFMNIICLGRFIGMLPEVAQLDEKKK